MGSRSKIDRLCRTVVQKEFRYRGRNIRGAEIDFARQIEMLPSSMHIRARGQKTPLGASLRGQIKTIICDYVGLTARDSQP